MKFTCGVGFNSKGEYKHLLNGKYTEAYSTWRRMI